METMRQLFGLSVYSRFPSYLPTILGAIILLLAVLGYFTISAVRHHENPADKIVPSATQLYAALEHSLTPDRNGNIPLVQDTLISLRRFGIGIILASVSSILIGLNMGLFPFIEAFLLRPLQVVAKIPPLALLPIIFIFAGLGEITKVLLIFIGMFPAITLAVYHETKGIPKEHTVKAMTLGASIPEVVGSVVLPQIMPYALTTIRINLLVAWLFLIASESIAADAGLGYRIFLVRRYLAMDTILIYVIWITLLSYLLDFALQQFVKHQYPWYQK